MVNCAVPSCKNDSRRQTKQNSNVTFHRFPKNEDLLRKWVDALQRADWEPTIRSFVCSAHFADSAMYFSKSGLRKLVPLAVPELSLHCLEPQKHTVKRKRKTSKIKPYVFVASDGKKVKKERDTPRKDAYSLQASDCPVNQKLKKRISNLTKLSKRRRLRCNALYASLNRIRKKVSTMTHTLKDLQQKIALNSELSCALEASGVCTAELFKGLWKKERSQSPEPPEEEDYFYSEIPNDIESYVQKQSSPQKRITIYTTSVPSDCSPALSELDVQVSVKTESCSPRAEPEAVFVPSGAACRVCLLTNVPVVAIGDDLRNFYEKLTTSMVGNRSSPSEALTLLCRGCIASLQRCRRFAEMARRVPPPGNSGNLPLPPVPFPFPPVPSHHKYSSSPNPELALFTQRDCALD